MLDLNAELLGQATDVLSSIDDAIYTRPAQLFEGQRVGGHVRHIVGFYERLIEGLREGRIDYAARRRDPLIEASRTAALERIEAIRAHLGRDDRAFACADIQVQPEDAIAGSFRSSAGRELEAVASHTVHHFALIAVLLRYFGLQVRRDFGVSKATLRHWAAGKQAA